MRSTEHSIEYESLSPSSFEDLRACRLRAAFRRDARPPSQHPTSAAQRLGNVCHRVLESLVRTGALLSDSWDDAFATSWGEEIRREALVLERGGHPVSEPERWPDYQVKRARLRKVAVRLRDILCELPPTAALLPEEALHGFDGRLRGVADLVVRPPGPTFLSTTRRAACWTNLYCRERDTSASFTSTPLSKPTASESGLTVLSSFR